MCDEQLKKLFDKLSTLQKEIDAWFDSPMMIAATPLDDLLDKEQEIVRAVVLALNLPKAVQELKTASAAAQKAADDYRAGKISLELRNAAVKTAVDRRDDMVAVLNYSMQLALDEYNSLLRKQPNLEFEFGLREVRTACSTL